jgi:hypothetical protein
MSSHAWFGSGDLILLWVLKKIYIRKVTNTSSRCPNGTDDALLFFSMLKVSQFVTV